MVITVISGKGGTGKTTIAVAISELENETVNVDCDVEAPNMYLYYEGMDIEQEDFSGGKKAVVDETTCIRCGKCQSVCQFKAIKDGITVPFRCEGCGACVLVCPQKSIRLIDEKSANVYLTHIGKGTLSRSQMEIGSEGSGKLITLLRKKAQKYAEGRITINDGSPGIGCPVISSITATDAVLIVTEPTQSGMEDLKRVVTLCWQFGIMIFVCINKADINPEVANQIEDYCKENHFYLVGKLPYDDTVLRSINELKPIIYYDNSSANHAIRQMWSELKGILVNQVNTRRNNLS